eukprot:364218-Chlamydomonas_euryale.AAC.16
MGGPILMPVRRSPDRWLKRWLPGTTQTTTQSRGRLPRGLCSTAWTAIRQPRQLPRISCRTMAHGHRGWFVGRDIPTLPHAAANTASSSSLATESRWPTLRHASGVGHSLSGTYPPRTRRTLQRIGCYQSGPPLRHHSPVLAFKRTTPKRSCPYYCLSTSSVGLVLLQNLRSSLHHGAAAARARAGLQPARGCATGAPGVRVPGGAAATGPRAGTCRRRRTARDAGPRVPRGRRQHVHPWRQCWRRQAAVRGRSCQGASRGEFLMLSMSALASPPGCCCYNVAGGACPRCTVGVGVWYALGGRAAWPETTHDEDTDTDGGGQARHEQPGVLASGCPGSAASRMTRRSGVECVLIGVLFRGRLTPCVLARGAPLPAVAA